MPKSPQGPSSATESYYQPPQGEAERLIASARIALTAFALFALWLDPSEPTRYAGATYALLLVYSVYALLIRVRIWRVEAPLGWLPLITHASDLATFSVLTAFTDGSRSPFFLYFIFLLACATLRWHSAGAVRTALVVLIVFVAFGFREALIRDPEFELNSFVIRSGNVLIMGVLLGYLGTYMERRTSELSLLTLWPARLPREYPDFLRRALEYAAEILGAGRVLITWDAVEDAFFHVALWSATDWQQIELSAGSFAALVPADLQEHDFLCSDVRMPAPTLVHSPSRGFWRWRGAPVCRDLRDRFQIESVIALRLSGETFGGRLFILDKRPMSSNDLVLGEIVARHVTASLDLYYMTQRARGAAATEERLTMVRDLHDGIAQSLTVANLQLEVAAHVLADGDLEGGRRRLIDLQRLISEEAARLREFIRETRVLVNRPAATDQLNLKTDLAAFLERIAGQWGLKAELMITEGLDNRISARLRREGYSIVREAVFNAARHAHGSSVEAVINLEGAVLSIIVSDNGNGFGFTGEYNLAKMEATNSGPFMLRQRVKSLAGTMTIQSGNTGSSIYISLPLGS